MRSEQTRLTSALNDAESELNDRVNRLFALTPRRKPNDGRANLRVIPPYREMPSDRGVERIALDHGGRGGKPPPRATEGDKKIRCGFPAME